MKDLIISIKPPEKILKGAGIPDTSFIPSYIYKLNIELINNSNQYKLCSFSSTLGNGIRYLKNAEFTGPDNISDKVKIVEPCENTHNNNVIVFANNINLSPASTNIISLDIGLCDKYTLDCVENAGDKIPHREKIHYYGHLICNDYVASSSATSVAYDYELTVKCDDEEIKTGESTKYYIHCSAGQYDVTRSVYIRCILDNGLEFIGDSCNLQPKNVYGFNGKTIIKWDVGSLQPSEIKRIGYMVRVKSDVEAGLTLKSRLNSNCVNNSTYTQCPSSCEHILTVK